MPRCSCLLNGYVDEEGKAAPRPGTLTTLYVNAYAVTRNYGGSEEGGWYYNSGTPLASVPIPGTWIEIVSGEGMAYERRYMSKDPRFPRKAMAIKRYLLRTLGDKESADDVYDVEDTIQVRVEVEDHPAVPWPAETPHYE